MPTRRQLERPSRRAPRPPLTAARVLAWADDFRARTGRWPKTTDGPVSADQNEKWLNVDMALRLGFRGLPGDDSLARLLDRQRGVRNVKALPKLTEAKVCRWAKAHCGRTGAWPNEDSGPVADAPGEELVQRQRRPPQRRPRLARRRHAGETPGPPTRRPQPDQRAPADRAAGPEMGAGPRAAHGAVAARLVRPSVGGPGGGLAVPRRLLA
jgi:hypothetical protein